MMQIKIAIAAIILIITNYGAWYFATQRGENRMYEVQIDMATAVSDELLHRQDVAEKRLIIINNSQVQHDKDQAVINRLADNLRRVQAQRICGNPLPDRASAADKNTGAWIFSETVDSNFAGLQRRASELFRECDQINIDAIRNNSQGIGIGAIE